MKMAFVCDWLTGMRGGERCLDALCEIWPKADIFTLYHQPGSVSKRIEIHRIKTSFIQNLPGNNVTFRRWLPLFPKAIESFDLSGYDLVISLSHCVAKGVIIKNGIHLCYCHTPMRYAWHMRDIYLARFGKLNRWTAGKVLDNLQKWDQRISSRVDSFIANSENVRKRILNCYGRDAEVIHPPVDCSRFQIDESLGDYYLVVSALVPYKRVDLAVKAFNRINRKLLVVGNGPELPFLKKVASKNIEFIQQASDNKIAEYLKNCNALIFPGEEDFGIVPLEAQACGKAVIAFGKGGALETIIGLNQMPQKKGPTGIFFTKQSPDCLRQAVHKFENNRHKFDPRKCRNNAIKFDRPIYQKSIQTFVQSIMKQGIYHA